MRLFLCIVLAALLTAAATASETTFDQADTSFDHMSSYMADGERVWLDPVLDRFALKTVDGYDVALMAEDMTDQLSNRIEIEMLPVGVLDVTVTRGSAREMMREMRRDPRVAWAEPVFTYESWETPEYMTGHFVIALDEGRTIDEFSSLHAAAGALYLKQHDTFMFTLIEMVLPADRDLDVLDIVDMYQDVPGITFCEPVFYFPAGHYRPNDTFFPQQWPLENDNGNPGTIDSDVDADLAWDITRGDASVIIAIQDEGVDVDHPDLVNNMVPGVDTTDASPPGGTPGNAACNDNHGTACAGIAAAEQDNSLGVSGVCPDCSIAPVRMAYGSVWTTNLWSANAFNWSRVNNVAVSSNSWGGGSPSSTLTSAINNCYNNGRGGLGCLILFSSGNGNNSTVSYPGYLSNVVAVGATSPCDQRKDPSSCDGETWWGSNYGSALDVVAPGVLYYTTDIAGGCGSVAGDYVSNFNGTSAACPNAAGVAGLIFSRNPGLTAAEARAILEGSADDQVGRPSEDPPGRDNHHGWGRVNAHTAVLSVGPLDPPEVDSISPTSGSLVGFTNVTISGSFFNFSSQVTFGGVPANSVTYVNENTLIAQTPPAAELGAVDVTVTTSLGSDTLVDAFTYKPLLSVFGNPNLGETLSVRGTGIPNGNWGCVRDTELGPRTKKGILWQIGFQNFVIVKNAWQDGIPLTGSGQGAKSYTIPDDPGLIGETLHFEGVFDGNGPLPGKNLTLADLVSIVVLP